MLFPSFREWRYRKSMGIKKVGEIGRINGIIVLKYTSWVMRMEIILYSTLSGLSTSVGVLLLLRFRSGSFKGQNKVLSFFLSFAGGIMLGIATFDLIPHSLLFSPVKATILGIIFGTMMMWVLDKLIRHTHIVKDKLDTNMYKSMGYLIAAGIALHNLPEGLAIGAGFTSTPKLGITMAFAIALHNIPEGISIAFPLRYSGLRIVTIFLITATAGLFTPLGTILGILFAGVASQWTGFFLAFAAGAMVYICADELMPESHNQHGSFANIGFIIGIIVSFLLSIGN